MTRDRWYYNELGTWRMESERRFASRYRIEVTDDGRFSISESDSDLIEGETEREFETLLLAQQVCESIEAQALAPSAFAGDRA